MTPLNCPFFKLFHPFLKENLPCFFYLDRWNLAQRASLSAERWWNGKRDEYKKSLRHVVKQTCAEKGFCVDWSMFIGIRFLANIAQKESETAQPDMKSTLVKTILIQFPLVVFKEGEGLLPAYPMLNILIFPLFYPWVARSAYFWSNLLCSHWLVLTGKEVRRLSLHCTMIQALRSVILLIYHLPLPLFIGHPTFFFWASCLVWS